MSLCRLLAPVGVILLAALPARAAQERFPLPPEAWPEPVEDHPILPFVLLDRLEYRWSDAEGIDAWLWDAQGWIGGDWNKFWVKTEGERAGSETEEAQFEALYARLVSPFWYLQAGVRYDARPEPERAYAALGIQGLGVNWFEVDATIYVSEKGDVSANLEAEYDVFLSQRLVLQPRLETGVAADEDEERGIGQGFNDIELDLRLRFEVVREFAPYAGVSWSRLLGETADLARQEGEDTERTAIVAGVRAWF